MITGFSIFLWALSASPCQLEDERRIGALASAHIVEVAQKRNLPETEVGAVLILMRRDACSLLEHHAELYETTRTAIESECQHVTMFPFESEAQAIKAALGHVQERKPDLVVLAWAVASERAGEFKHVAIISEGTKALRTVAPSFGTAGETEESCISNPWPLAATSYGG
ncbi:hypothetical protein [Pseudomarimonas arenosa]|uniref:Uncharacterized protein n=1 Tax=Pseudomarimonas arenosa TaxID=2774145 RepID=A0AAW3ZTB3_9GAMM|nr:hypothetical protein [Pseudomarimonas arenosa]MBD8528297.1 hypothetical protein [Pseudomarimonas arenosa]